MLPHMNPRGEQPPSTTAGSLKKPPYAVGAALEKAKRQKKEKKKFLRQRNWAMELMWEMIPGGSNVGNRAREEKKPNKA